MHDIGCGNCGKILLRRLFSSCTTKDYAGSSSVTAGLSSNRYFSFESPTTMQTRVQTDRVAAWSRTDDVLKDIGDDYWKNIDKMDAYGNLIKEETNTIPQPIILKDSNTWAQKSANARCRALGYTSLDRNNTGKIAQGDFDGMDNTVEPPVEKTEKVFSDMNSCYQRLSDAGDPILYNGFMIVRFAGDASQNMKQYVTEILQGKFVFFFDSPIEGTFYLPPTTSETTVMLFASQGGSKTDPKGTLSSAKAPEPAGAYDHENLYVYNYFVFSDGDSESNLIFDKVKINGSVVMAKGSKASIADGHVHLHYNGTVLSDLAEAGIIEQNPDFTEVVGNTETVGGGTITVAGGYDSYYISTAPQLHVSLVSLAESSEDPPSGDAANVSVAESFIVLPRVIYLPKNPYGKLGDYFSVVGLNGAAVTKNLASVSGCVEIPKDPNYLYNRTSGATATLLDPGLYECKYTSSGVKRFLSM